MSDDLTISVIVPAFNAEHDLAAVLAPLMAWKTSGSINEVLVANDGSTDRTPFIAAELGAVVLTLPKQSGPAAARNFAAKQAVGKILWFVDADVIVHSDALEKLVSAFADTDISAAFGSYDADPPATNWASKYKNLMHRYYHQLGNHQASTFWSGCGAVRKSDFLLAGEFNADLYPYPSIEDIELGYRIRENGGKIVLLPDLLGKHLKRWTLGSVVVTDVFRRALPWSRLLIEKGSVIDDLNIGKSERIRAILAGCLTLSLLACLISTSVFKIAPIALICAFIGNWSFLRYLFQSAGLKTAILGGLFHQVYYLYSASIFVYCNFEAIVINRFFSRKLI